MNRNIVICIDGTGNDPNDAREPDHDTTNVWRLAEALCQDARQLVKYFPGLATSGEALLDLAGKYTGLGAEQLRNDAYAYLAEHYRTGDSIFLFGFSRGAAIVRDLANYIHDSGIGGERTTPIKLLGLWDTVAAFGIPTDLGSLPAQSINIGKKLDIPRNVEQTVHLLAIDEQREPFTPTLVESAANVEEIWFAGVHGDVGGGFKERQLAEISLRFMIERAQQLGLRFKASALEKIPCNEQGDGMIHTSQGKQPQRHREIVVRKDGQVSTLPPKLHHTVIERMQRPHYDPENVKQLHGHYAVVG